MARAWLRDDVGIPSGAVKIALDDDSCCGGACDHVGPDPDVPLPPGEEQVFPVLTLSARYRTGYDEDGNPMYSWVTIVKGPAVRWVARKEFDPKAGATLVTAKATMGYEGPVAVTETAQVSDGAGRKWRITGINQAADLLVMELVRIEET